MWKNLLVSLVLLGLMITPVLAEEISLEPGIEMEFVLDKNLELNVLGLEADASYSAQHYNAIVDIGLGDIITITPKLGVSRFATELDDFDVEFRSDIGWNAAIDARADLYRGVVDVALIGGYRFSRNGINEVDILGVVIDNPLKTTVTLHEWEIGALATKDLSEFDIPVEVYIGPVYSDLQGNCDVNLSFINIDTDIKAKNNIGLRAGLTVTPLENLYFAVDGKFVDETAISARASYLF